MATYPVVRTTYPPLPIPPAALPLQTAEQRGAQLFRFVLETGCTATLPGADLQLAHYAGIRIVACPRDLYPDVAYARLLDVHRTLASAVRRLESAETVPQVASGITPAEENAGPMAPLEPVPIVRPPSGTSVRVPEPRMAKKSASTPKLLTYGDLPRIARDPARPNLEPRRPVLYCPTCHGEYSADPSDYGQQLAGEAIMCGRCEDAMVLADRLTVMIPWGQRAAVLKAIDKAVQS